jgi:hypothetical protein
MNTKTHKILLAAQRALNSLDVERADEYDYPLHANDNRSRLLFADVGSETCDGLCVEYYGEVWEDAWQIALDAIANTEVASRLSSLRITGPDEGANGSRTHDFSSLLKSNAHFPNLRELYIRPTGVNDHNMVDIRDDQITAITARCPNLERLTLPQAPQPDFFTQSFPKLHYLNIGMAWQTHGFIRRMAAHHNMPALMRLEFSDSLSVFKRDNEDVPGIEKPKSLFELDESTRAFMAELGHGNAEELTKLQVMANQAYEDALNNSSYDDSITRYADYCALIKSSAIHQGMVLHLRNAYLSELEFRQLCALRPDVQLSAALEAPHVYISHWHEKFKTPYRHLLISQR